MEASEILKNEFKKYLAKNAAKRLELKKIMEPYKKLLSQMQAEEERLLEEQKLIKGEYEHQYIEPLFWRKRTNNIYYKGPEAKVIIYSLTYARYQTMYCHTNNSATIRIETRPELKKYKYTVTNTASEKDGRGNIRILNKWYRAAGTFTPDQQALLADRYQCKTLEEAEAKANELIKIINKLLRASEYYQKLVSMVSDEIDYLNIVEVQQ